MFIESWVEETCFGHKYYSIPEYENNGSSTINH